MRARLSVNELYFSSVRWFPPQQTMSLLHPCKSKGAMKFSPVVLAKAALQHSIGLAGFDRRSVRQCSIAGGHTGCMRLGTGSETGSGPSVTRHRGPTEAHLSLYIGGQHHTRKASHNRGAQTAQRITNADDVVAG